LAWQLALAVGLAIGFVCWLGYASLPLLAMLGFGCMAWLLASAVGLAMLVFSCMAWLWLGYWLWFN
jgi:hypothetical protein